MKKRLVETYKSINEGWVWVEMSRAFFLGTIAAGSDPSCVTSVSHFRGSLLCWTSRVCHFFWRWWLCVLCLLVLLINNEKKLKKRLVEAYKWINEGWVWVEMSRAFFLGTIAAGSDPSCVTSVSHFRGSLLCWTSRVCHFFWRWWLCVLCLLVLLI